MYVDSGATETVIAQQMLSMMEIKDSPQSRRGVDYEVANGIKIPNLGQKQFTGYDEAGVEREVTAQVCDVNKALLSVSKMCRAGNKVVFGAPEGNYIEDLTTGERIWMIEEGGMYALKMWVRSDGKSAHEPF